MKVARSLTLFSIYLLSGLFISFCSMDEIPQEGIRIRNLELTGGVNSLPDTFPAFAYYKGSHNLLTGLFRSEKALATPEGAAFLQSDDSINEVEEYYNRSFRENGWSVIQSHRSETEILLMAESPFGKLITVILRAGPKTDIKVYVKRLGGD